MGQLPPDFEATRLPQQMYVMAQWAKFFEAVAACPEGVGLRLDLAGTNVRRVQENIRRYSKRLHRNPVYTRVIDGVMYVTPIQYARVQMYVMAQKMPPQSVHERVVLPARSR